MVFVPAAMLRGGLATGPQCQGLLQAQQPSSTTGTNTATGTCPTGFVTQNNFWYLLLRRQRQVLIQQQVHVLLALYYRITFAYLLLRRQRQGQSSQPIANSGPAITVNPGSLVTLVGTGSYSPYGGTIVSYSWVQTSGTPVSLTGANTTTPTFTAPTVATSLVFSLTVTDGTGAVSNPATVSVTVTSAPLR